MYITRVTTYQYLRFVDRSSPVHDRYRHQDFLTSSSSHHDRRDVASAEPTHHVSTLVHYRRTVLVTAESASHSGRPMDPNAVASTLHTLGISGDGYGSKSSEDWRTSSLPTPGPPPPAPYGSMARPGGASGPPIGQPPPPPNQGAIGSRPPPYMSGGCNSGGMHGGPSKPGMPPPGPGGPPPMMGLMGQPPSQAQVRPPPPLGSARLAGLTFARPAVAQQRLWARRTPRPGPYGSLAKLCAADAQSRACGLSTPCEEAARGTRHASRPRVLRARCA